jgi:hypothetical protein
VEDRPRRQDPPGTCRAIRAVLGEDDGRNLALADDEDRAWGVVDDLGGHRAEDHRGDGTVAAVAEDDEVRLPGPGLLHDRRPRAPAEGQALDVAAGPLERPLGILEGDVGVAEQLGLDRIELGRGRRHPGRGEQLATGFEGADDVETGAVGPGKPG